MHTDLSARIQKIYTFFSFCFKQNPNIPPLRATFAVVVVVVVVVVVCVCVCVCVCGGGEVFFE